MITFDRPIKLLILWIILAESQCHIISGKSSSGDDCGLYDEKQAKDTGLYPWEATLLNKTEKDEWKYLCDGVLINSNTIVTAASCIQPLNSSVRIVLENIRVEFGISSEKTLKSLDTQRKVFDVSAILIHGGWGSNGLEYFHDFAMLKLDDEIETFSDFLRPVCLKNNKKIFDFKFGFANAFNRTRLYSESNDKNINNDEMNEKSEYHDEFTKLYLVVLQQWQTYFLAGNDSTNICGVQVGSGFYVEFQGKIYLRGIVSSNGRGEKSDCSDKYALFTDTLEYFTPADMKQTHLSHQKNHFIDFLDAKSLVREPVCRENGEELECSLELITFIARCRNDTIIWDQLKGQQLSLLNVIIDGRNDICAQYFNQVKSLKKLSLDKEKKTRTNIEVDGESLSKVLSDLKQLQEFKLENLEIRSLEGSLFNDSQLEKIVFSNNMISNISGNFLEGSTMLKEFTFAGNLLTDLPEELFFTNQNLEIIDLSSNQLRMLPEGLLKRNNLLKSFYVQENKLISIHEFLFSKNSQLEIIDISQNPIREYPEHLLENLQNLKVFFIDQRPIDYTLYLYCKDGPISYEFFKITFELEEVNLSYCNIRDLPVGLLNNLEKLKKFDFTKNAIWFISDDFFLNNENLEVIFLLSNQIKILPENLLKNLPKLKLFDIRDNSLTSISKNFFSKNLQIEEIDMSNNPIKILPVLLFANLEMLKVLYVEEFPPNSISSHVVSNNKKLKYLNLSNNENISTIIESENLFKNNVELQELHISNSRIQNLPDNFLKLLKKLKKIDLSYNNEINAIPENFFSNNELLEIVDMFGYDQFPQLPKTLLNGLKSLKMFYLNRFLLDSVNQTNFFTVNAEKASQIYFIHGKPIPRYPMYIQSRLGYRLKYL